MPCKLRNSHPQGRLVVGAVEVGVRAQVPHRRFDIVNCGGKRRGRSQPVIRRRADIAVLGQLRASSLIALPRPGAKPTPVNRQNRRMEPGLLRTHDIHHLLRIATGVAFRNSLRKHQRSKKED